MQFVIRPLRDHRAATSRAGFTLIELLVALSVVSVATTIFMKMYMTSMDLAKLSRNREVATSIAQEQLNLLVMDPASYAWDLERANEDGLFRIRKNVDDPRAGLQARPPSVLPLDRRAREHQEIVYDQFRWRAFGKLGARGLYYEVYVDVYWDQGGRERYMTLTGAVARSEAEPGWTEAKQ